MWFGRPIFAIFLCVGCAGLQTAGQQRPTGDDDASANQPAATGVPAAPAEAFDGLPVTRSRPTLSVLSRSLFYIKENYVDPGRVSPPAMFRGALTALALGVPEFRLDPPYAEAAASVVTITVGIRRVTVHPDAVQTPWALRGAMQSLLGFVSDALPLPPNVPSRAAWLAELEELATNGMLQALDRGSWLISSPEYAERRPNVDAAKTAGIGVAIKRNAQGDMIVGRVFGSDAEQAGIQTGDRLLSIDDHPTTRLSMDNAIECLTGPVGSPVELVIHRPGARADQKIKITRAAQAAPSVAETRVLPGQSPTDAPVGYLRIPFLGPGVASEVDSALTSLASARVGGIILDLRGNNGGLFEQAVKLADAFVKTGRLATLRGREGIIGSASAADSGREPTVPLAVLVDRQTASGAELVAAALRDNNRGIIIGETSAKAGSVQSLFDIPSDRGAPKESAAGLRLTTGVLLTPRDQPVERLGVVPDIAVQPITEQPGRTGRWFPPPPKENAGKGIVWYLRQPVRNDDDDDGDSGDDDGAPQIASGDDFVATLARQLLASARASDRTQLLANAAGQIERARAETDRRVIANLSQRGVDWRPAPLVERMQARLTLAVVKTTPLTAGGHATLHATLTNLDARPLHRALVTVRASSALFNGNQFLFGLVPAQATATVDLPINLPADLPPLIDELTATAVADGLAPIDAPPVAVAVTGPPPPALSFRFGAAIPVGASGTRRRLPITITNHGAGVASHFAGRVWPAAPAHGLNVIEGFFQGRDLAPGGAITSPVLLDAGARATSAPPSTLTVAVDLPRVGLRHVTTIPAPADGHGDEAGSEVTPPRVTIEEPGLVTTATTNLIGTVTAPRGVKDVVVAVTGPGDDDRPIKVFYQAGDSNRDALALTATIPLFPGRNHVTVVARDSAGSRTVMTMTVLRATSDVH